MKPLKRYKFVIEYNGRRFSGWQRQPNARTVQGTLECVAEKVCKRPVTFVGSGRTDAGVHAWGQVAHADIPDIFQDAHKALFFGMNQQLRNHHIAIVRVEEVEPNFHARFWARCRTYVYRIVMRQYPAAIEADRVWVYPHMLDVDKMVKCANLLIGTKDFKAFQSGGCVSPTSVRHMYDVALTQQVCDPSELHLIFKANAFLYHQVRNMVGALVAVGSGRMSVERFEYFVSSADMKIKPQMAPSAGLYLHSVLYKL